MWRLRPNSVCSGRIATQLDKAPQSPQFSHKSGWMNTRVLRAVASPRLMRRRCSVAQTWS
jgi:hypothetical protein